ncbi:hypothetical protein [Asticcacaulis sp. AC402]|uniref:hypothetical protein n=1 Tax=Asticcacaulis sp. AC402 TaxID=1282361 RepID=UPI0003C3C0E5|nr:hypothetical protein [Asticcacaulis sp. AC402]ESQ74086.1 hypothetical protein ABAC402_15655 [Asticcacaulis sp. AC402]
MQTAYTQSIHFPYDNAKAADVDAIDSLVIEQATGQDNEAIAAEMQAFYRQYGAGMIKDRGLPVLTSTLGRRDVFFIRAGASGRLLAVSAIFNHDDERVREFGGQCSAFPHFGLQRLLNRVGLAWELHRGVSNPAIALVDRRNQPSSRNLIACGFQRRRPSSQLIAKLGISAERFRQLHLFQMAEYVADYQVTLLKSAIDGIDVRSSATGKTLPLRSHLGFLPANDNYPFDQA